MALDKGVIKTIAAVVIGVVVVVILLGVGLAIWLPRRMISLEYWPKPEDGYSDSSLISYKPNDVGAVQMWVRRINNFFDEYQGNKPESRFRLDCSPWSYVVQGEEVCDVKILTDGPCSVPAGYGYSRGQPCVFLRLNQRSGWVPEPYNSSFRLPADMPEDLKMHIRSTRDVRHANMVWITCQGENSMDQENIGPVQYYPARGLPTYYFPYSTQPGYLSPYVAVQFERLRPGVVVSVECRAWAHNIQYDRYHRRGSVHFEMLLDY